jgi:hypothetical protein
LGSAFEGSANRLPHSYAKNATRQSHPGPKTRCGIGDGAPVILVLTWLLPDRTLDRIFDFISRQALKGQQAAKSQHARA